jgi:hypothetical protein
VGALRPAQVSAALPALARRSGRPGARRMTASSSAFRLARAGRVTALARPRCRPSWASVTGLAAAELRRGRWRTAGRGAAAGRAAVHGTGAPRSSRKDVRVVPLSGAFLPLCCCRRDRLSSRPPRVAVTCCRRALYAAKRSVRNRVRTADPFPAPARRGAAPGNRVARPAPDQFDAPGIPARIYGISLPLTGAK